MQPTLLTTLLLPTLEGRLLQQSRHLRSRNTTVAMGATFAVD